MVWMAIPRPATALGTRLPAALPNLESKCVVMSEVTF
jgi:hypothetical protein